MGLFSFVGGLLGGGGNTTTTQTNSQKTVVENNVEVNIDIEELTKTLEENTMKEIFFGSQVAYADLSLKEKDLKAKADALKVSTLSLKQQIKTDEEMRTYTIIGIFIAVVTLIYNYNKPKKGK